MQPQLTEGFQGHWGFFSAGERETVGGQAKKLQRASTVKTSVQLVPTINYKATKLTHFQG